MKIVLTDRTYDGDVKHEVEDENLGGDLSLVFEYLENYRESLAICLPHVNVGRRLAMEAKIKRIEGLTIKYKEFIKFLNYIDSEEHAL